ncbi:MAG: hypothetical protein JXR76_08595 [Deltaproteobacteria bacterium]|nr:hypothetical protein [Deltaproteobacteria bacterium]
MNTEQSTDHVTRVKKARVNPNSRFFSAPMPIAVNVEMFVFAALSMLGCEESVHTVEVKMATPKSGIVSDETLFLDLDTKGPYDSVVHEYSLFPATYENGEPVVHGEVDPKVTILAEGDDTVETDVRGIVYIPTSTDTSVRAAPYPLIVFLHGNYSACRLKKTYRIFRPKVVCH